MKLLPRFHLRLAGIFTYLSILSISGCDVSVRDPDAESQREKVVLETWTGTPASSSYQYVKCTATRPTRSYASANQLCGAKAGAPAGLANYSWQTNCATGNCGVISVFAHYMLPDDLGTNQSLHIEAFDNPQFNASPVASLIISGFNASKPVSTGREEMYLAPGEYYFRAYLTPEGAAPLPYLLQGMELVSNAPVGFLGALSGAQRLLVTPGSQESEPVHIYLDQLFKKPVPVEDTQARFRLKVGLADKETALEKFREVHILLLKEADLELNPSYDFTISSNSLLEGEGSSDFVSPSLEVGSYYLFAYVDGNGNGFVDEGELGGFITSEEKPTLVSIDKNRTKVLSLELSAFKK